ncbi:hypothetical protein IFO70_12035 [Phormidium tenue FACHB-886]|nr:hypothetical protein [Phormidium tenue FACHB-886]
MASPDDRSVILRLSAQQLSQPNLLAGLDAWRQLGLLSDRQILQFAEEYLICPAPSFIPAAAGFTDDFVTIDQPSPQPAPALASVALLPVTTAPQPSSFLTRTLQSFMAEVSVIWLLFLGVFLVVVSSGVLAASQWQNFSVVGQYGILFAYTLAFAAVGVWIGRRSQLRLTARMLQIATLLIIPVNFWMIDGLRLSSSLAGLGLAAIATLSLSATTLFLLRPRNGMVTGERAALTAVNAIGLSWLHLGWHWATVPLVATYVGTIGTALLTLRQVGRRTAVSSTESASGGRYVAAPLIVALATLLLVGRAILGAGVAVSQLGLTFGVCGWLLCWMIQRDRLPSVWRSAGVVLLLLGWLVSVSADSPWQAIAVSGLGLWLLLDQLQTQRDSQILVAIGLVGLQAYCLLWQVVPSTLRQGWVGWAEQVAGDRGMPWALVGLGIFPYVLVTLGLAAWLRRMSGSGEQSANRTLPAARFDLAQQAELMALSLGLVLECLSLANPLLRSLNLTLAVLTLVEVFRKRVPALPLLYLTHLCALAAVLSWIDWLFPNWDALDWARLLLLAMAIEWGLSLDFGRAALLEDQRWRQSAWNLGLGLAAVSYALLLSRVGLGWFETTLNGETLNPNLIWLVTPLLLTVMSRSRRAATHLAAGLSSIALIAQLLLVAQPYAWLISLGVGTLLMLVNTGTLRSLPTALLTVGFGLGFEAVAIYETFDRLSLPAIANLLAATLWLLWLLRSWLARHQTVLSQLYASAANVWAIALCVVTLLYLTTVGLLEPSGAMLLATGLTTGAIAFRISQQPTDLGFLGVGWSIELLAILLVRLNGGTAVGVAIATLGLGLVSQVLGDIWVSRARSSYRASWHLIPLLYAGLGWLIAHGLAAADGFTAQTGLYTLAAALIGIGVGRRQLSLKPLTLLSVLFFTAGAYELLGYQLAQAKGGNLGDGMTLLAGLAALIAVVGRLGCRWLLPYLRLSLPELRAIAHLHWAVGSSLALVALPLTFSAFGRMYWLGILGLLTEYALGNGRQDGEDRPPELSDNLTIAQSGKSNWTKNSSFLRASWTYAGILEFLLLTGRGLDWLIPNPLLLGWAGAIAAVVAIGLYFLPWDRWGWLLDPWQKTAMVLPMTIVVLTLQPIAIQSLLIVAAFYAWLAKSTRNIRLSYLAVLLLDWAILRYLGQQNSLSLLWISVALGGSLLYAAQIDPALRSVPGREQRHWLRSLATGLICLTALYQAEIETGASGFWVGLFALGIGLVFVLLGIVLRVRAFLYIGTAAFILRVLRLLWLFVSTYSLLLWAIGIVLGLLFIWIAANFEARRHQMNALLQYWMTELESWE